MELQEILKALERYTGVFPREALREAVARREEITPALLRILEETARHVEILEDDPQYMAYEWAMFLLAQFREARAYPLIVDLVGTPGDLIEEALGDIVREDLGRILASVSHGDTGPIKRLIEDPQVNRWVRSAALTALVVLVATGQIPREEAITYLGNLIRTVGPADEILTWAVSSASDLSPAELMDDIRQVFEEGWVNTQVLDLDWVEQRVAEGWDAALERLRGDVYAQLVSDVVKETEWWAAWKPQSTSTASGTQMGGTYVRAGRKVGRNEPCPCGSGKKYKKCCGR